MEKIQTKIQNGILMEYRKLFSVVIRGCGGIIFRQHFKKFLGFGEEKCTNTIKMMEEYKLIKQKRVGQSTLIIMRNATLIRFGLDGKYVKVTAARMIHSATFCEMMLRTHNPENINMIEYKLSRGNLSFYSVMNSTNILHRIYNYLESSGEHNLDSLKWSMDELDKKSEFIMSNHKGRQDKLSRSTLKTDDLITLRCNDVFITDVKDTGDAIELSVAIFATGKRADKISELINRTAVALTDMFGEINVKYIFDIYHLGEKSASTEDKVLRNLLAIKGNELKEDFYNDNIHYHWYNRKKSLFSGIDLDKWL